MFSRALLLARAAAVASLLVSTVQPAFADARSTAKSQVDFGIKVAQNGLWKEATYRWEKAVEAADDSKLQASYSMIAHVGTHNAYHIGQIIYVRKEQGSWNPANGVK